jgi:tRNA A37 threonylcarbamoyladenosine dehydratase
MSDTTDITIPVWQQRTALLLGQNRVKQLWQANVLVVGLGGVGAYAAELICRAGVGKMTIVDGDTIDPTNRNRQLPALSSTEYKSKAKLMAARLKDINPDLILDSREIFIRDHLTDELLQEKFDFVVDAIDSLSPKVHLIMKCMERNYPIVSSMGSGGKTDPAQIKVADIADTYHCRLAKAVRKRLHRHQIHTGLTVVFSPEPVPDEAIATNGSEDEFRSFAGTISYMPAAFGCFCAAAAIQHLSSKN